MSYLKTTYDVYKDAALMPDVGLCCTTNPIWELPGLKIPKIMQEMNYGCGTTVHARDLTNNPKMLYVGVGGGMELLQFSYFNREKGGVIGVDVVDEMLEASHKNFKEAERLNPWFKSDFVELKKGDAMHLPVSGNSIDVAAQNCLFNIFKTDDLKKAIAEMYRVLKPYGRVLILEFSIPSNMLMRRIYMFYFRYILPFIGSVISGDRYAYRYLNETVEEFPYGDEFCQLLVKSGFQNVTMHPQTFGIATIYYGDKVLD